MNLLKELETAYNYFGHCDLKAGDKVKFLDEYVDFWNKVKEEKEKIGEEFGLINDPETYRDVVYEVEKVSKFFSGPAICLKELKFFTRVIKSWFVLYPKTWKSLNGIVVFEKV